MKFTGLFDKLKIIFNLITNSNILIVLVFLIIATFILRLSNKINNKKMGFIICLIELIVFGVTFYLEKESLTIVGNSLIDNIFLNFYFPSIYVYLFIFVVSIVLFIYTLLNKAISKTYKTITYIYFYTFNFIFVLLVNVIATNNIDIFAKESLFTNTNSLILLELSTLLFFLYLVINTLVYITNYLILLVENKKVFKLNKKEKLTPVNFEITMDKEEASFIPEVSISFNELVDRIENNIDDKINLVPEVNLNRVLDTKIELIPEVKTGYKFLDPILFDEVNDDIINLEDNLNKKMSFIDLSVVKPAKEEKLTLKDYKLFSKMLKTVILNNGSTNLTISDILNRDLLNEYSNEEYNKFERILNSCLN